MSKSEINNKLILAVENGTDEQVYCIISSS